MFLCFAKISIFYNTDTCACKDLEIVSFSGFPSSFTGFDKPHVLILIIRIFGKNIQSYSTISAANDMTVFGMTAFQNKLFVSFVFLPRVASFVRNVMAKNTFYSS